MKTRFTYLLLLLGFLSLSGSVGASDNPVIYGVMRASSTWGSSSKDGVYSFPVTNPTSFSEELLDGGMLSITGVYHSDGAYYTIVKTTPMVTRYTLYKYNTSPEWKKDGTGSRLSLPTTLMAFDPVTEKLYAMTQTGSKNDVLNELDISEASPKLTTKGKIPDIYTMSINARGEMFGIGVKGELYKVNLETIEYELVGMTGLIPVSPESQGTTFDPLVPDRMYWSASLSGGVKGLYEVDTRSAYTKLITTYETAEVMTGIFIFPPAYTEGAPDIVKKLDIAFATPGSLTGKITFAVPSKTADGSELTGTVDASIQVNSDTPFSVSGLAAGSDYISSDITFTNGFQEIKVTLSNGAGSSNTASYFIWAGHDTPSAVGNLVLSKNENENAAVAWDMPTGQHGGALDMESLRYKIIRHIDAKKQVLEEAYTETSFVDSSVAEGEMGNYSYEVIPYTNTGTGFSNISNSLPLGAAFWVPFKEEFVTRANFNRWTVNNISGEDVVYNWGYDPASGGQVGSLRRSTGGGSSEDCNSWFISPPIRLEKDRTHKISYKVAEYVQDRVGKLEVTLGTSLNPEDHMEIIETHIVNGNSTLTYETIIQLHTVAEDGIYYLGFHDISTPEGYQLYIDDVFVEYSDLPAGVTDLVILPASNGQLKTLISFNAPTTTIEGMPLDLISSVKIYRNDSEEPFWVNEEEIELGQPFNLSDNAPINGLNTYRIVCSNPTGEGEAVEETVFVGMDVPAAVGNLTLANQNGDAVLSWSAPAIGVNGGYIDAASLRYKIVRSDNVVISENLEATTVTDSNVPRDIQRYYNYKVTPFTETGDGTTTSTIVMRFGDPYEAPFFESFAGAAFTQKTWMAFEMSGPTFGNWVAVPAAGMPDATPQDNDGGFVTFTSTRSFPGDSLRMVSPAIDISKFSAPHLSFWLFHVEGNGVTQDRMWIEVSNKGGAYESLTSKAITVATGASDKQGWTLYEFNLDRYKGSDNIVLGFIGVSDYGSNIHVDNISVTENYVWPAINSLKASEDNGVVSLSWDTPTANSGEALAPVLGYNVYRDNQKINNDIVESETYTDLIEQDGTYKYTVTVVYDTKESAPSNEVTVEVIITDIPSATYDAVSIYSSNHHIVIKGAQSQQVFIYSIEGRLVHDFVARNETERVSVDQGIYIVRVGKKAIKVINL